MVHSIPHLYVNGTNYQVGKAIGSEFKHRIRRFIRKYDDFKEKIHPFIKSQRGKQILDDYCRQIEKYLPWYLAEMKGVSDGSEVDFDVILALNMTVELERLIPLDCRNSTTKQCTDLFLNKNDLNILLHNEDADPAIHDTGYFVTCKIISTLYNGKMSPEEEFTCYCYPGNLPGNAFGFNSKGFVFGVNTMYSNHIIKDRLPHQMLTRFMMSSTSLKDFEEKIATYPLAYGVSINLGFYGDDLNLLASDLNSNEMHEIKRALFNYELAPSLDDSNRNRVSKQIVFDSFYAHVNCYERIDPDQIQNKITSSYHRKEKIKQYKEPNSLSDLLIIASDDTDLEYPIFRTPRPTDLSQTVATAVFDLNNQLLKVYVFSENKTEPFLKLKMN